jgi:hypothetical protein
MECRSQRLEIVPHPVFAALFQQARIRIDYGDIVDELCHRQVGHAGTTTQVQNPLRAVETNAPGATFHSK